MKRSKSAKSLALALALALPALALAKGPTAKEKITELSAAGKTIAVVYVKADGALVQNYAEGARQFGAAPGAASVKEILKAELPADFQACADAVTKALNTGFGVTSFKPVSASAIPFTKGFFGSQPDFSATDYEAYAVVEPKLVYSLTGASFPKQLKQVAILEVTVGQVVTNKKGKKGNSVFKKLASSKEGKDGTIPAEPTALSECLAISPASALIPDLNSAIEKSIADFASKK